MSFLEFPSGTLTPAMVTLCPGETLPIPELALPEIPSVVATGSKEHYICDGYEDEPVSKTITFAAGKPIWRWTDARGQEMESNKLPNTAELDSQGQAHSIVFTAYVPIRSSDEEVVPDPHPDTSPLEVGTYEVEIIDELTIDVIATRSGTMSQLGAVVSEEAEDLCWELVLPINDDSDEGRDQADYTDNLIGSSDNDIASLTIPTIRKSHE